MRIRKRCPPSVELDRLSSTPPPPFPLYPTRNHLVVAGTNTCLSLHPIHGDSNSKHQDPQQHIGASAAHTRVRGRYDPSSVDTSPPASSVSSSAEQKVIPFKKKRPSFDGTDSTKFKKKNNAGKKREVLVDDDGAEVSKNKGQRCTRSNGSGWRCGQPPLKGFLMCQHHIHQSRLRYSSYTPNNRAPHHGIHEDEDEDSQLETRKARTISSLLAQTVPLP